MTSVRLYGRLRTRSSLSVVTEGFRSVLEEEGLLAGVSGVEESEIEEASPASGADARHGLYTGPMSHVWEMFQTGKHEHYWIMLAPNSDKLPQDLVAILRSYVERFTAARVHFLAPSKWAASVVNGYLDECMSVPHGVSKEYVVQQELSQMMRAEFMSGKFRVLHFSTSARERKGTVELIQAWKELERMWALPGELLCVMDYQAQGALMDTLADLEISLPKSVRVTQRADLNAHAMAQNLARSHVVCQPSRGEAFGLVPLEALCTGVPVVATDTTGHSEYLGQGGEVRGAEIILSDTPGPLDDLPGSRGPRVSPPAIVSSLGTARLWWPEMQAEAMGYARNWQALWSWKVSLTPFVERLKST